MKKKIILIFLTFFLANPLLAFKHNGFWACMDTIREKKELNKIWKSKQKAWKIWL